LQSPLGGFVKLNRPAAWESEEVMCVVLLLLLLVELAKVTNYIGSPFKCLRMEILNGLTFYALT